MSENRNRRPEESSKLPYISLLVLVLMIAGMLYIGYEYIADDAADVDELLNTPTDTTGRELQPLPTADTPLAQPESVESSTGDPQTIDDVAEDTKPAETQTSDDKIEEAKPAPKIETPASSSGSEVGGVEITHTVQAGETFYGIANRYNLKSSTLKGINPEIQDESKDVKSGVTRIKIRVKAVHTVGPGDILRVVADKYGITVDQLMAANKKTKNYAARGEKLIIPFPEKK